MTEPVFDLRGESGSMRDLLVETWRSRELVRTLARKDFLVRYRRAAFGVGWALCLPLVQAGVLALVIPRLVRFSTPGGYLAFVFSGTVAWSFFSTTLSQGTSSIVDGQSVTTRVYFPRSVLPIAAVLTNLYALVPTIGIVVFITAVTGSASPRLLVLIPASVLISLLSASMTMVLAALHVYFRDVKYIVQAALLAWFYVTPVIYPLGAVHGLRPWFEINPVTGAVELFRLATVGADPTWLTALWWLLGWTVALTVAALVMHRRYDRVFVDLL